MLFLFLPANYNMKQLFSQEQFSNASTNDKLPLECRNCNSSFLRTKKHIVATLNPNSNKKPSEFCSAKCRHAFNGVYFTLSCHNCEKEITKTKSEMKTKSHFCSQSCAATFNNRNKTSGTRRSKLENWLQEQLSSLYPNLQILYNDKTAIKSELDLWVPSLNVAFEINGIFHYEPIYGVNKLKRIQENDKSKSLLCHEAKIDLCIIDASQQKYFKPSTSQKYLDIIVRVIEERK